MDTLARRSLLESSYRSPGDLGHARERKIQPQLPRFSRRQVLQVGHDPAHKRGLVADNASVLLVGRNYAIDESLRSALDDGKRGPEFVDDVPKQLATLSLTRLQSLGHRVSGADSAVSRGPSTGTR